MLNPDEEARLVRELIGSAEAMGQAMSPNAAAMIASDLEGVPLATVLHALRSIRGNYKGRLTFPVIRERILELDGRPGRDEAWALALQGLDERDSVVWTDEIQKALAAARPILRIGDKIGARMAFLSAYDRLVQAERDAGTAPEWIVSIGWDGDRRAQALEQAVMLKRIPVTRAAELGYRPPALTAEGQAIAALLTAPDGAKQEPKGLPPEFRSRLQQLRADVVAHKKRAEDANRARLAAELQELRDRKKRAADQVAQRQESEKQP